ncbi:kin of IRRE 2 [Brachionus plicatilis]|uniref:Kin of IRRE 2 n=1 Tax=Brachionus plicatilis TaxID=10195 RepID=A0A3M7PKV7_BRAPC|nr:kin of IRRE 2 [Brachionus plicatilis]
MALVYTIILCFLISRLQCYEDLSLFSDFETPRMITENVNITAYMGETINLPCQVANLGNRHVNWLRIKNGIPLTLTVGYHQFSRNMRYRVIRVSDPANVESWNFEIRKVSFEDQGIYQCYIKLNSKEKIKANVNLIVKHIKEKNLANMMSNNVARSERLSADALEKIDVLPNSWIKLRCNATGLVSLKSDKNSRSSFGLQWFKDDFPIEQDLRRLKKWVSSYDNSDYMELELYAVEPNDSGVYQCRKDKTILKNVFLQISTSVSSIKIGSFFIQTFMLLTFFI